MKSDKILYLHVGPHKTGTTSIQNALLINEEKLNSINIGVHKNLRLNGSMDANCNVLSLSFVRPKVINIVRLKKTVPPPSHKLRSEHLHLLKQMFNNYNTIVVSSEGFSFLRTKSEKKLIKQFLEKLGGVKIQVIMTHREQKDWERSWINHLKRKNKLWVHIQAIPEEHRISAEWYLDFNSFKTFWEDISDFPLQIIDYSKVMREEGNIVPDFFRKIGLNPKEYETNVFRNISPRNNKKRLSFIQKIKNKILKK